MLTAILCVLAAQNIINYTRQLATKRIQAKNKADSILAAATPKNFDNPQESRRLTTRLKFYSLLNSLGNDKTLHSEIRFGIILLDPDFYRGTYTEKFGDSILEACAIQPFSVPALTRLPLLSPFASDSGTCSYESYGYQYLPTRHAAGNDEKSNPCELARARSFTHVVVISRTGDAFMESRLNCEKQ
ncbi:hypothetical protein [Variovorax arabinosiphilus]|uniref:hypothetical protein n=1 Tax=Variovorax arabinosiphilus TaxID=3053498 RepID=UPI0025755C66|nr:MULTISPECIES: hypothetical protein [unclassified Variovorax]MDM0122287.1 hypothetical protein [Variovorax sp. J2L1-78]MDM0131184.1 hypothetical protein [Variovorax sp. J2L1-63]MDM0235050.1 hypothetical protein [Variovorax sp. J2R1-6]